MIKETKAAASRPVFKSTSKQGCLTSSSEDVLGGSKLRPLLEGRFKDKVPLWRRT